MLYNLVFDTTVFPLEACLERIAAVVLDRRAQPTTATAKLQGRHAFASTANHR